MPIVLLLGAVVAVWGLHALISGENRKARASESAPPAATSSPEPSARPTGPIKQGHGKVVYLTFDDGPDRVWTPRVLAMLAKHGAHATFFMLAQHSRRLPDLVDEVRAAGDAVGNHSVSHPKLTKLSPAALHAQVANGIQSRCFRPPYGATDHRVLAEIRRDGLQQVLWDVDPRDWSRPGVAVIVKTGAGSCETGCDRDHARRRRQSGTDRGGVGHDPA
ncbi:peptidoglycan/xylan/chitin deacetylase (PgdA/CDA1 family) [Kribbella aluminosa]|uniref:Peptidoglycan/xylan/chitin deacetylase (PgdA/CDA1 family) n=1 Tax=Kribbella aluminosa TaxID=416017 RepID=A0ABS4UTP6_9ACTN|nr:polysaccharide deacetylase family protein [Kribbella aluminosa]MBP2355018.1 peptidoglycan/xylan/chitin deacetylase (PgdA/CDA1 family) [Kribbella aluminosa]